MHVRVTRESEVVGQGSRRRSTGHGHNFKIQRCVHRRIFRDEHIEKEVCRLDRYIGKSGSVFMAERRSRRSPKIMEYAHIPSRTNISIMECPDHLVFNRRRRAMSVSANKNVWNRIGVTLERCRFILQREAMQI